jgi:hypothetical protein
MMVSHDVVEVTQLPACGGDVEGEEFLLPADLQPRVKASRIEEGAPANGRAARDEAKHARAPENRASRERTAMHRLAGWVQALFIADEYARSRETEPWLGEGAGEARKRIRRPPRIVVGKRDDLSIERFDAGIACRRAGVCRPFENADVRERAAHGARATVAGPVVDDGDLLGARDFDESAEGVQQRCTSISCDDHDARRQIHRPHLVRVDAVLDSRSAWRCRHSSMEFPRFAGQVRAFGGCQPCSP